MINFLIIEIEFKNSNEDEEQQIDDQNQPEIIIDENNLDSKTETENKLKEYKDDQNDTKDNLKNQKINKLGTFIDTNKFKNLNEDVQDKNLKR